MGAAREPRRRREGDAPHRGGGGADGRARGGPADARAARRGAATSRACAVDLAALAARRGRRRARDRARARHRARRSRRRRASPATRTSCARCSRNLLRNALVHTPAGTPIEVDVARAGGECALRCATTGRACRPTTRRAVRALLARRGRARARPRRRRARPRDRRGDRGRPRRPGGGGERARRRRGVRGGARPRCPAGRSGAARRGRARAAARRCDRLISPARRVELAVGQRGAQLFLSNLPTDVFGTSSMTREGVRHLPAPPRPRRGGGAAPRRRASPPSRSTTQASGRSDQPLVRHRDDRRLRDAVVAHQAVLERDGGDPLAAGLDDVLRAVRDPHEAVGVDRGDVARAQPAVVEALRVAPTP